MRQVPLMLDSYLYISFHPPPVGDEDAPSPNRAKEGFADRTYPADFEWAPFLTGQTRAFRQVLGPPEEWAIGIDFLLVRFNCFTLKDRHNGSDYFQE